MGRRRTTLDFTCNMAGGDPREAVVCVVHLGLRMPTWSEWKVDLSRAKEHPVIDKINAMRTFTRIVETNSFTRAADSLNIPRATASTIVQSLEALLGTALLIRTTRRISITAEGVTYYERCAQILSDIDELEASLRSTPGDVVGDLRIEIVGAVASDLVMPALEGFHARYPKLNLSIGVRNGPVNLVADAIDCSIQLGELPDSNLVARRLGKLETVTCASPSYLSRYAVPQQIADLREHLAVNWIEPRSGRDDEIAFEVNGKTSSTKLKSVVRVSDERAYLTCGINGFGIIQPTRVAAQPFLDNGQLREVLPEICTVPTPLSVTFLKSQTKTERVRVFVEWLVDVFEKKDLADQDMSHVRRLLKDMHAA